MNYHKSIRLVICNKSTKKFFFSKVPKINRDGVTVLKESHHTDILEKIQQLGHKMKKYSKSNSAEKKSLFSFQKNLSVFETTTSPGQNKQKH